MIGVQSVLGSVLAIEWDPDITGYLAVAIGVLVLCGSVFLLLYTNVGSRLGFLVAWTGLWGWILIMGIVWWVFAIGWVGADPSWQVSLVTNDPTISSEETIRELGQIQPDEQPPDDWEVMPDNEKGDPESAADPALVEAFDVSGPTEYEKFRVLETGGREYRPLGLPSNAIIDFFIPSRSTPHYAVVQAQPYTEAAPVDLNADTLAPRELDQSQSVLDVVLVRDRGDKRLPPALITLLSAALFFQGCWLLHRRDRLQDAIRSEPAGS